MNLPALTNPKLLRGPGRRPLAEGPALDKERLVTALLRLARAEGVAALNMRRVAAELEVSPRLLYHFVRDKEEMLDLLGDAILDRTMPNLAEPDWAQRLRNIASFCRQACAGYAGLPAAILARSLNRRDGASATQIRNAVFGALEQAGLTPPQADRAYVTFSALVLGGMVMVENIDSGGDLVVARESVQRSLEMGIELLLFGIARMAATN